MEVEYYDRTGAGGGARGFNEPRQRRHLVHLLWAEALGQLLVLLQQLLLLLLLRGRLDRRGIGAVERVRREPEAGVEERHERGRRRRPPLGRGPRQR
jgi:hypothetical protein